MQPTEAPRNTPEAATQLRSFWYPVADSRELRKAPLERRIAGETLVLFRDSEGKARVLAAACPHRGGNLARGTVRDGCITCPFHGWRFDGNGRCVGVPSEPPSRPLPRGGTRAYEVIEQQGLIWTHLGAPGAAVAPPPRFEELEDASFRAFHVQESVPLPFDWWVENILDVTHVPFVHRLTYGGQNPVLEGGYPIESGDELGFTARVTTRHRYSLWARVLHGSVSHFDMEIRVRHHMPGSTVFDIDMGGGRRQRLLFLATPEDGANTRVWIFVLRNYLRHIPFADAVGRAFTRQVIREDLELARHALWHITLAQPRPLSVAADEPCVEFLRLLKLWRDRERQPHPVRDPEQAHG